MTIKYMFYYINTERVAIYTATLQLVVSDTWTACTLIWRSYTVSRMYIAAILFYRSTEQELDHHSNGATEVSDSNNLTLAGV